MTNEDRMKRMADRMALLMVFYWARYGDFMPLDDDDFWNSKDADEIRAMPEYQQAIQFIRDML